MASRPKSGRTSSTRSASRGRKPATIDLKAKEVGDTADTAADDVKSSASFGRPELASKDTKKTPEATADKSAAESKSVPASKKSEKPAETNDTAAGTPKKPENDKSQTKTAKPKEKKNSSGGFVSALMGAAAAVVGLGVIGQFDGARHIPLIGSLYSVSESSSAVDASELQALQDQVQELSSGNVDIAPIVERVNSLESQIETTQAAGIDDGLLDRLTSLEAGLETLRSGLPENADRSELETTLNDVLNRLSVVEASSSEDGTIQSLSALDEKLAELEQTISGLRAEIVQNTDGLKTLSSQSGELEETVASVRASEKVARSVAANALGTALENDDPLGLPISSLEALMGQSAETQRLAELDNEGIPSLKQLVADIDAFSGSIGEGSPAADATLSDRFWANAQKLVSFRSSGPREGDDPLAVLSRVKAYVTGAELARAKTEWTKLPKELQDQGAGISGKLDKRLEAQNLYEAITENLAAAAG